MWFYYKKIAKRWENYWLQLCYEFYIVTIFYFKTRIFLNCYKYILSQIKIGDERYERSKLAGV